VYSAVPNLPLNELVNRTPLSVLSVESNSSYSETADLASSQPGAATVREQLLYGESTVREGDLSIDDGQD
jgi:hypothetical protein